MIFVSKMHWFQVRLWANHYATTVLHVLLTLSTLLLEWIRNVTLVQRVLIMENIVCLPGLFHRILMINHAGRGISVAILSIMLGMLFIQSGYSTLLACVQMTCRHANRCSKDLLHMLWHSALTSLEWHLSRWKIYTNVRRKDEKSKWWWDCCLQHAKLYLAILLLADDCNLNWS